jgi:beta-phosphoglucomutase
LRYDAVFFDFDGVLADSEPLHHACWAEVLAPVGIALDWETYSANCIGVSDWAMLDFFVILSDGRLTRDDLRPLYPVKQQIFRERATSTPLIPPPTVELVQSLNGVRRAVVTSSVQVEIEPLLDRAGVLPYLDATVYGGDVIRLKPAPDPYLLAAQRTGARIPLVLEDSAAGLASAEAAGFDVVRVLSPADVPALVRSRLST